MKKHLRVLSLCLLLLPTTGCVLAAGAAIGAGAMYSLGDDSAQLYLESGIDDVFAASQAEFKERGSLEEVRAGNKEDYLRARVDTEEVEVFLTHLTEGTTRMVVKARKWKDMVPALEVAERIADRIAYRVDH